MLWDDGPATVRTLADALYPGGSTSEYATVQKLLERLSDKGHVWRRADGRQHVWSAKVKREELVARPDVRALYDEVIESLNRELSQYERIKKFALLPREFSMSTGELTPTLKVKRKVVEEKYRDLIEGMYR